MKSLEERLREHPHLYERIIRLIEVVENTDGDVVKADEAEQRVLDELRKMGQTALQSWADRKNERVERAADADPALQRKEKKASTGRHGSGGSK
jgi:hypothetical protein